MRKSLYRYALYLAASVILAAPLQAETIRIPIGDQGTSSSSQLPRMGATRDAVRERFGTPKELVEPVGEPPISRWVYDQFTVYFEYDRVIHSVRHHQPTQQP